MTHPTDHQTICLAIAEVCGWDLNMIGWGRIGKLAKAVRASGGSAEIVREHYGQVDVSSDWWWYREHWLGKRGERPDDGWIRKTWGVWRLPLVLNAAIEPAGFQSLRNFLERQ
jgi:hypothetical protein